MGVKGRSAEFLVGNKEQVTENWRTSDSSYKLAKKFPELCSAVLWKTKLMSYEIAYLAEETSKQNDEGAAWVPLTAYSKLLKEMNEEDIIKQKGTRT